MSGKLKASKRVAWLIPTLVIGVSIVGVIVTSSMSIRDSFFAWSYGAFLLGFFYALLMYVGFVLIFKITTGIKASERYFYGAWAGFLFLIITVILNVEVIVNLPSDPSGSQKILAVLATTISLLGVIWSGCLLRLSRETKTAT
jgi:hypothetical protein